MRPRVLIACSLLVAASACTQDRVATCPGNQDEGLIQGTVALGGIPARILVTVAGGADLYSPIERVFRILAASDGSYSLAVPPGVYSLCVDIRSEDGARAPTSWYRRAGPPYLSSNRDTLQVTAGSVISADFVLSSLRMSVTLPSDLRGASLSLTCFPRDSRIGGSAAMASRTISDGTETVEIPGLQPDLYRVRFQVSGYHRATQQFWLPPVWVPATRDSSESAWIEAPAGGIVPASFSLPDLPAHLEGRVTGSWQHFGQNPEIGLVSRDSLLVATIPIDTDDGTFQSEIYFPVPVKACVEIYDISRWYEGRSFADASVIDLRSGGAAPPVEVVESGVVLDFQERAETSYWYWRAQVEFVDPQSLMVLQEITVDSGGKETLRPVSNLDSGNYLLHILPVYGNPPLLEQWYDASSGPEGARVVTIPDSGGVAQVQIHLAAAGR